MAKKKVIRTRRCTTYNYNKVDIFHYDPRIEFVCSDGLIRLVSEENPLNTAVEDRKRVMLIVTIHEAVELAAKLNQLAVRAAFEE